MVQAEGLYLYFQCCVVIGGLGYLAYLLLEEWS